jgi:methionyl-tRNA formyltransferase
MKGVYLIVSSKYWHKTLFENLKKKIDGEWYFISNEKEFCTDNLEKIKPEYVFIPHWSKFIPEQIYTNYKCIVFHMTDLPFGRGGSPLQNLISRGIYETKISAINVVKDLDAGDVYLKKPLSLYGTAEEIFLRASEIIEKMILEIITDQLKSSPQSGEPIVFRRRKPEESNIVNLSDIKTVFDYIRMLDAEDYPSAFIETEFFRFEFSRAFLRFDNSIEANVRIFKK